jgi:hypothetical protein
MSDLSEFFFGSSPAVVRLQLLEISHPDFSTTYRVVRNAVGGVSVTHEGPAGPFAYAHYPLKINVVGSGNGLEQSLEVVFGDLGQVLPTEIAAVMQANTMQTKPILKYREYRSDDLTAPLSAVQTFQVTTVAFTKTGAAISAKPPSFNRTRTGELYTIEKFPMLRGFI